MERIELERLPLSTDRLFLLKPECVEFFPEGFSGLELVAHIFGGVVLRATSSLTTRPFLKSSRDRRNEAGSVAISFMLGYFISQQQEARSMINGLRFFSAKPSTG